MLPNIIIDRIEFTLQKDNNTQEVFILSQVDYNFSTSYALEDNSQKRTDVYLSGSNNSLPNKLFLEWLANTPSDW